MEKEIEANLLEFQSDVYKLYLSVREESKNADLIAKTGYIYFDQNNGFLRKVLSRILRPIRNSLNSWYFSSRTFVESSARAGEILKNEEIRLILCARFKNEIPPNSTYEELEREVIRVVASSLTKKSVSQKFAINRKPFLFAIIVHKILKAGIENYCPNRKERSFYKKSPILLP